eukprot:g5350.t1 g5350   contig2:354052-355188(+)
MCSSNSLTYKQSSCMDRHSTDVSDDSYHTNSTKSPNSITSFLKQLFLLTAVSISVLEFSQWLPFNIPYVSSAAIKTYIPAWYRYDTTNSLFDNSVWTYGTDYLLTVVMTILAVKCLRATDASSSGSDAANVNSNVGNASSFNLRMYSASLLICYAVSTLAGGWAHQHFTTISSLNTMHFRLLWIICVGNVSFASCYMGLIGREVQSKFGVKGLLPLGPVWFWPGYGLYMTIACGLGYISFKRPACDIFIAGITQFPSTFYCLVALGARTWPSLTTKKNASGGAEGGDVGGVDEGGKKNAIELVRLPYRMIYYVGFIGNAPLLPMYPLLVQYTNMSLAEVNTLLHTWLMVMWGMQGISLLHLCRAISTGETSNVATKME